MEKLCNLDLMNHLEEHQCIQKMIQNRKNRLYVSWRNTLNKDCKMIGPQTKCFCNHRYKEHQNKISNTTNTKITKCLSKCACKEFYYIPTHGAYDFKCLCKHSYKEHDPVKKICGKQKCKCQGFKSTWSCSCGLKFSEHTTMVETYEERKISGKNMGDMDRMVDELDIGNINQKQQIKEVEKELSVLQVQKVKQEKIPNQIKVLKSNSLAKPKPNLNPNVKLTSKLNK